MNSVELQGIPIHNISFNSYNSGECNGIRIKDKFLSKNFSEFQLYLFRYRINIVNKAAVLVREIYFQNFLNIQELQTELILGLLWNLDKYYEIPWTSL